MFDIFVSLERLKQAESERASLLQQLTELKITMNDTKSQLSEKTQELASLKVF
jgi:hypothetical protein